MPQYTFSVKAAVTVEASSEEEALEVLRITMAITEEDVPYGDVMIYLPSWEEATLQEVYLE